MRRTGGVLSFTDYMLSHCEQGLFDSESIMVRAPNGNVGHLGKCEVCSKRGWLGAGRKLCTPCWWRTKR